MVNSGVDSNKNVYPILTDSNGKQYVIIDGSVTVIQPTAANLKATVTQLEKDRTVTCDTAANLKATVTQAAKDRTITDLKPDGANTLACLDANTRAGFVKITDGSDEAIIETDDNNISGAQKTLATINLNYSWDGSNWVRQTPSSFTPSLTWDVVTHEWVATAGAWAEETSSSHWLGMNLNNDATPAIDDQVGIGSFRVPSSAAYTLVIMLTKASNNAILHFLVNGSDVAQIDSYAAGTSYNQIESISLGTLTAGLKILSIKAASKHGSSSDYRIKINAIQVAKT